MDFKNRNYYLIGHYGMDQDAPKRIKETFKCKIRYNHYVCCDKYYTCCVCIDQKLSNDLEQYLQENKISYDRVYSNADKTDISCKIWFDYKTKLKIEAQLERAKFLFDLKGKKEKEYEQ